MSPFVLSALVVLAPVVACEGTAPTAPAAPTLGARDTLALDTSPSAPEATAATQPPAAAVSKVPSTPPSPWRSGNAPSATAETVTRWTAVAVHHGLALPHSEADLAKGGDAAYEANLAAIVEQLPVRPRTVNYLVDEEHGYYHSPDEFWLEPAPADAETTARIEAALALARKGDAAALAAMIEGLVPFHPHYRPLVDAVARYEKICAENAWSPLEMPRNKRITPELEAAVQQRIAAEGMVVDGEPVADSVRRYRLARQLPALRRHIDDELFVDLNIPCEQRLTTLRLNVRRWRHSAITAADRAHVAVNLAAQELVFRVGDEEKVRSRTVVGSNRSFFSKELKRRIFRNATPILADRISKVIVNPDWNVPGRIAREEIEPAIAADPEYLTKNHFRMVETASGGRIYIQQPGDHNALGRMKILFPNNEGVYMHDTPSKARFQNPVRAASHGCVRVEKVFDLGVALLNHDRANNPARAADADLTVGHIKAMFGRNKSIPFTIEQPIPVVFEYYTASVDSVEGLQVVRFHPDIYQYDREALDILAARAQAASPAVPAAPAP
jgi:murein L,D-transpeptidase YcbB/YkuD